MTMLRKLRAFVGKLRRVLPGLGEFWYDFRMFSANAASADHWRSTSNEHALLIKEYHRLEKGLALPNPREGFGANVIRDVIKLVDKLERDDGPFFHGNCARASLEAYRAAPTCTDELGQKIANFNAGLDRSDLPPAGAALVTREELVAARNIDFEQFARSRTSIRDYTGDPVPETAIRKAVAIAMKSPRVCNRGTSRCHAILDRVTMDKALSFQNGNAGFGDKAGAVLIITSDRRGFLDYGERNQCWIDGGLFAMTLCYALHAQGYGTCMLNWSVLSKRDRELRRAIPIPEHEAIITLMAVGVIPPTLRIAISPREPVETAFSVIRPQA